MFVRLALSAGLTLAAALGVAAAGDAPPPPQLKPGEAVKIVEHGADGSVTGWVRQNWGGRALELCVEKISGDKRRPGDLYEVAARSKKVDGRDQPEEADRAVLRQLGPGDRVELEWYREDKRPRAATVKLIRAFPRTGAVSGRVARHDKEWFELELSAAPKGFEDMVKQVFYFQVDWMANPDKKDPKRRWVPNPEQLKLFESLADGDLLEVNYKADSRLRVESPKKTGRGEGPAEKRPEPERRPKSEPKAPPKGDPEPD